MKSKFIYAIGIAGMLLMSCNNSKKQQIDQLPEAEAIGDNSMTSLDWAGTYEGILPCADCEGIKTVMTINQDNTYVVKETYQGKVDKPFESKGTFKWDDDGQKITFSDKIRPPYFVGENTLTLLDKDGNQTKGKLADKYILKKVKDQLIGKKWHLVSFKGKDIQLKEAKAEHAFLEFLEDFTLHGYTGCNNLQGAFEVGETQQITFSKLINTLKACPEMETENEFLSTLNNAAHYTFEDHALILYDSEHNNLATFRPAN